MDKNNPSKSEGSEFPSNADRQGVDKAPGEEFGKSEPVTNTDLKGKKVDADPEKETDKPAR